MIVPRIGKILIGPVRAARVILVVNDRKHRRGCDLTQVTIFGAGSLRRAVNVCLRRLLRLSDVDYITAEVPLCPAKKPATS